MSAPDAVDDPVRLATRSGLAPVPLLVAALRTARPHQWPKNALVLAAPLAGATLGPRRNGILDLLTAMLAFVAASTAVYFVNDVRDAERDRRHPRKRLRPVASGELGKAPALVLAALAGVAAEAAGLLVLDVWFTVIITAYLLTSLLYSLGLKHLAVAELALVASGFVLRAFGGAAAVHIPPSGWFILVCSLGALVVATAKRGTELAALDEAAVLHRPSLRRYSVSGLRLAARLLGAAMLVSYLAWALVQPDRWVAHWPVVTLVPLVGALLRFDALTTRGGSVRVEDLLLRDRVMLRWELAWLVLFALGFWL